MTHTVCLSICFLLALCCINTGTAKGILDLGCPDGSQQHYCLLDPCQHTSCEAYPDAVCQSDYCGGCYARFFLGRREVTDKCDLTVSTCPHKGQVFFQCLPCQQYCNGAVLCNVQCQTGCGCPSDKFVFDEQNKQCVHKLQCPTTAAAIETGCPGGSLPVNCYVNPCDPRFAPSCDNIPGAVCRPDFCGGCNAKFFVGKQEFEVTDLCG